MCEEAEDLMERLREAELLGSWKALNWLAYELHEGMKAKDIIEKIKDGMVSLQEELCVIFRRQHGIFLGERKGKKVEASNS